MNRMWLRDSARGLSARPMFRPDSVARLDRFLILGRVHLRGRGSGVELDQPIGWVLDFEGESLARLRNLADHESAIAAAQRGRGSPTA